VVADGIYFYNASTKAIEFLSFANRKITPITKAEIAPFGALSVSPDVRWILYTQTDREDLHIMLVENFSW